MISNKLHLAVQEQICSFLKEEQILLEYPCKGHIADIYWKKHNLVFEVQCSPMTLKECKRRTRDLEHLGMKVIWILHQKNFNKRHLSPMEAFLRKHKKALYTNIHQGGVGIIYDQEEVLFFNKRLRKSKPALVNLHHPKFFFKRVFFPGAITHLSLFRRLLSNQNIWKEKGYFFWKKKKIQWRYISTYLLWKIRL